MTQFLANIMILVFFLDAHSISAYATTTLFVCRFACVSGVCAVLLDNPQSFGVKYTIQVYLYI